MPELHYYIINKPFGVLSQFTEEGGHPTLGSLYNFEKDVYPVGRLDRDSEGLLILSNDKTLNQKILHPKSKKGKVYLAQVENNILPKAIKALTEGVEIRIKKKVYKAKAEVVSVTEKPSWLGERTPPIRFRASIPTSWVKIQISEGKNRQVRRMFAKVGNPVLRLVRIEIGRLNIEDLGTESVKKVSAPWLFKKLDL